MAKTVEETFEFEVGDKVLAYYRGLLYKATCIQRRFTDEGTIQYYVHYTGYKKKYDEWSVYYDVLEINKINLAHKENLESIRRAYRASLSKKSQETRKQPGKRKRGRPKKNVEQSAGSSSAKNVVQSARPASAKKVKQSAGPSSAKNVVQSARPVSAKKVKQSARPPSAKDVQSARPASAKKVKQSAGPSSAKNIVQSARPVSAKKVKQSAGPSSAKNVQSARPVSAKKVKQSAGPSSAKNVVQSARPVSAKKVKQSAGPSSAKNVVQSARPVSAKNVKLRHISVQLVDILKYGETASKPAEQPVEDSDIQKLAEPDSAQLTEQTTEKCAETATANFVVSASTQLRRLSVRLVDILKYPETATTQLAGLSSPQFVELALEKSDIQKLAESDSAQFTEPLVEKSTEAAVENSAEAALLTFEEPATTQFAEQDVEDSDIQIFVEPDSAQFAESGTAQFADAVVENSAEAALLTFEEPATTQFGELAVEVSDIQIFIEPDSTQLTEPASAQFVERAVEDSDIQIFAEPATAQLAEPAIEKSVKLAVQTFAEPATTEFVGPALAKYAELRVEESDILKFAEKYFAPFTAPAVEKSAESEIQTFEEPATTIAGPSSAQFSKLTVEESDLLKFEEPYFELFTKPATSQLLEPGVEKSAESAIQTCVEPAVGESAIPVVEQSIQSDEGEAAVRAVENVVIDIIPRSEVSSKRVKKSQEPWTTEDASSSTPAKKNEVCTPKNNVEHAAGPSISKFVEPAIEKPAVSPIHTYLESSTAQLAEPAVEESAIPVVEQSIQPDEDEAAVRAVENVVIDIIPRSEQLANELLKELELPLVLKKAMVFDRIMHFGSQKVLKFAKENNFAEIIYTFAYSSYFIDDDQKKNSTMFCLTLMNYFNICVNNRLTYPIEKRCCLIKELCFRTRTSIEPAIDFKFKSQLNPKYIWCYLYGPMYLVRFIDALSKILSSNSWFPDYDLETFVHQIKELLRFLVDNFDTYFSNGDYIDPPEAKE